MNTGLFLLPQTAINMPYLGLAYISAALRHAGRKVEVYDMNIEAWRHLQEHRNLWEADHIYEWGNIVYDWGYATEQMTKILSLIKPYILEYFSTVDIRRFDVLGFAVLHSNWFVISSILQELRKYHPSVKIVAGGPAVTVLPYFREVIDSLKSGLLDAAVIGEGEEAIVELVTRWERGSTAAGIPGVITTDRENGINFTPLQGPFNINNDLVADFDDYNLLGYGRYHTDVHELQGPFESDTQYLPFIMSRGCISGCKFCADRTYSRNFAFRDPGKIFFELKALAEKYGITYFVANDLLLNGNPQFLEKVSDLLIENNLQIVWGGYAKVDGKLTFAFLQKLRKAGCEFLDFGVETGSSGVADAMRKNITIDTASRNIIDAHKSGIRVTINLIYSYPGESRKDFMETVSFVKKHKKYLSHIVLGSYTLIPKALLRNLKSKDDILDYCLGNKKPELMDGICDDNQTRQEKYEILSELKQQVFRASRRRNTVKRIMKKYFPFFLRGRWVVRTGRRDGDYTG